MSKALAMLQAWEELAGQGLGIPGGSASNGRVHTKRPAQPPPATAPAAPMTPAEKFNLAAPRRGAGRIARSQPSEEDVSGCEDGACDCCATPGSGRVHACSAAMFSRGAAGVNILLQIFRVTIANRFQSAGCCPKRLVAGYGQLLPPRIPAGVGADIGADRRVCSSCGLLPELWWNMHLLVGPSFVI